MLTDVMVMYSCHTRGEVYLKSIDVVLACRLKEIMLTELNRFLFKVKETLNLNLLWHETAGNQATEVYSITHEASLALDTVLNPTPPRVEFEDGRFQPIKESR